MDIEEDEFKVSHLSMGWSGEEVMQQVNQNYFLNDCKSLVHFERILMSYNWNNYELDMWEGGALGLFEALRR